MFNIVSSLLLVLYFKAASAQINKQKDIALIKHARNFSNKSMAQHDMAGVSSHWLNEFIVIGGNGGGNIGKDSATARLKRQLDQTPGLTYVRTPKEIIISDADTLAFETGKWIGLKTNDKNPKWLGGNYSAMWLKRNGIWKLRSELFVTLKHY
jgi:hypothetical protein